MADAFIQLASDGSGKKVDNESLTVAGQTVYRQRTQVSGAGDVQIAAVVNAAPTTEYGLVTRNIPSGTQPVSAAALPLPTGASTAALQQNDALTNTQLRATAVPVDTELPAAAAPNDDIVNPTAPSVVSHIIGWDPANARWKRVRITAGGRLVVVGDKYQSVPQDSDSPPIMAAGLSCSAADSAPAARVDADGDVTQLLVDRDGSLYTRGHPARIWHAVFDGASQQTNATLKAAAGATLSLYVTDIACSTAGIVDVSLLDGSGGSVKWKGRFGLAPGGEMSVALRTPIKLTANTLLALTTSAAIGVTITVCGFTAE